MEAIRNLFLRIEFFVKAAISNSAVIQIIGVTRKESIFDTTKNMNANV
jgi:hypothetical protein